MGWFEIQCTDGTHRLSLIEIKDLITKKAIPVSRIAITEEEIPIGVKRISSEN